MMNKLIITSLIVALLAGFGLLCFYVVDYMKQYSQYQALTSQIADVTQELAQTPRPPQDLEQRLAAAEASLSAEQKAFPDKLNSTEIINTILKLADECRVKAIPMTTREWSLEKAGEGYPVFRLSMGVKGTLSQLVNFVSELENGEFETLIIENLSVNRVTGQTEDEIVRDGPTPVTASLDIAIYTQSLNSD